MKKFLIILSCVALLIPAAALSVFAEESYTLSFTYVGGSYSDQNWFLNGASLPFSSFTRSVSYGDVISFEFDDDENSVYLNGELIGDGFGSDANCEFTIVGDVTVSYTYTGAFTCNMDIPPVDPFSPVNDGVDSSISYTGQILSFLANNTTTLVLIGLSVAMFAVLPFAISKIKQLIKGY